MEVKQEEAGNIKREAEESHAYKDLVGVKRSWNYELKKWGLEYQRLQFLI